MNDDLPNALSRHGIELPPETAAKMEAYCRELWSWNEKLNLTRHDDYEKFVTRDLWDSLALSRLLLPGESVLDVGSGGGAPGAILAILRPDLTVALCESVGKKAKALESIVAAAGIAATVHAVRGESLLEQRAFSAVTVRAVGSLIQMLDWFAPRWTSIGRLLAFKGPKWIEERGEARHRGLLKKLELRKAAAYRSPSAEFESVILALWPKGTPKAPWMDLIGAAGDSGETGEQG